MPVGIGAGGYLGVGRETTSGTYVAPEKYLLLRSEGLGYAQDTVWRRPLRGIADTFGAVPGNVRVEGDISLEVTEDTLPYLLYGAHGALTRTGSTPNFTYTYVPNAAAVPSSTLSITVVRNAQVFGFVGCVISSMEYTIEDGLLVCTMSILGQDEASQALPTPTYVDTAPYGAGMYSVQIPTATQVFDTDTFSFSVEDNAEPQYRLKNTGRGAQFVKFGERTVNVSVERDFESRAEYDIYKALTRRSITVVASKGINNSIAFTTPAAIVDSYEVTGLTGQGDLIRAAVTYQGVYDTATTRSFEIVIKGQEDIT